MKALVQRVHHAQVTVNGGHVGAIEQGMLAYVGIGREDTLSTAKKMIDKLIHYRIFTNIHDPDKLGKLDLNVQDIDGGLLLVPQFTLMAHTQKGRRPDFAPAMPPAEAEVLFVQLVDYAKQVHAKVQTGAFGASMTVTAANDGPINFLLEV